MSRNYKFNQNEDAYLVLLKYFNGDPLLLDKKVIFFVFHRLYQL